MSGSYTKVEGVSEMIGKILYGSTPVKTEWQRYKDVDYEFSPTPDIAKPKRSFRERKLERAHYGIGGLHYRTVRRAKIAYDYVLRNREDYDEHSTVQKPIVIHTLKSKKIRKFFRFIKKNKFYMSGNVSDVFNRISKEKKLKVFNELGD